ncbi:MAG: alpha/beta hydrolase [Alphaproteobacteria bacterium]|nr:alpha/beta hydrolase [Alphaproteobacteria bacterium]
MNRLLLLIPTVLILLATTDPTYSADDTDKGEIATVQRKITTGYVDTKTGRLFYRDSGGTGPVLLCIHGNSTGSWLFENLMNENSTMRLISFDSPGHGESFRASDDTATEIYTFPGCAKTLLEGLDQLMPGIGQFNVLGISKGGHEAINLYELARDRVRSLIISGSPPLPLFESESHAGEILSTAFKSIPAGALSGKGESYTEEEAKLYLKANGFEAAEVLKRVKAAMDTDGRARGLMFKSVFANQRVDEVKSLQEAKIRILMLGGEEDEFINYEYVKAKEWSPHIHIQIIKGKNHSFVWNHAKLFNEIIVQHLS